MSYANGNLALVAETIGGKKRRVWLYTSADAKATVIAGGYISDGVKFGMAVGDIVFIIDTATPTGSFAFVTSVSGNAVNLAYGTIS